MPNCSPRVVASKVRRVDNRASHEYRRTVSQRSFASAEYALKKKRTRREQFLEEMERIVPWARLEAAVAPSYPRSGRVG